VVDRYPINSEFFSQLLIFRPENFYSEGVRECYIRTGVFTVSGSRSILQKSQRITLVHSRVSGKATPDTGWVQKTKSILGALCHEKNVLVTSIGMLHYDFPLFMWLSGGGQAIVISDGIVPWRSGRSSEYDWFFGHSNIYWIYKERPGSNQSTPVSKQLRDGLIFSLSHIAYAGEIRSGGIMENMLATFCSLGGRLVHSPEEKAQEQRRISGDEGRKSRSRMADPDCSMPDFKTRMIWHFTRQRHTPWPGEGWHEYLSGLAGVGQSVPYSGRDALNRIVSTRRIEGSSYLIRDRARVVCFTAASPAELRNLMHFQKHLHRYRFEPYGIGFQEKYIRDHGGRPVIYGQKEIFDSFPDSDRYLFQSSGSRSRSWQEEKEWRIRDFLDFSDLDASQFLLMVRSDEDVFELDLDGLNHVLVWNLIICDLSSGVRDFPEDSSVKLR
jgi:hypothetical protein